MVAWGMVVEVEAPEAPGGKVKQVGIPIRMSETPGQVRDLGSVTGQHTASVAVDSALTGRRSTLSCKRLAGTFLRPGPGLDNLFESLYRLYVLVGRMEGRPRRPSGDCVHTQFLPLHQRRLPLLRRTR